MDTTRAVGLADAEELDPGPGITELDDVGIAPEPAAPAATGPTSRNQPETATEPAPAKRNLDDDPDFRQWKSKMDQRQTELQKALADEQRRRAELEAFAEQARQDQAQAQIAYLERQLEEAEDPEQARRIRRQMASVEAATETAAWQRWIAHVNTQVSAAGLNPQEFNPMSYQGPTGAMQFERDLAAAKARKLEHEVTVAKQAADPTNIEAIINKRVAEALQKAGLNSVDLGQPAGAPVNTPDQWQRDLAALQSGRMDPTAFSKKWGNR